MKAFCLRYTLIVMGWLALLAAGTPASGKVTWDEVRTVTFDEWSTLPRVGNSGFTDPDFVHPTDWTFPFFHHTYDVNDSVEQPYNSFGGEVEPNLLAYQNWGAYRRLGNPAVGGSTTGLRPDYEGGALTLNMRSLDIAANYFSPQFTQPIKATITGYRADASQPYNTPAYWKPIYTKTVELLPPDAYPVMVNDSLRYRYEANYTTVDLSGWNAIDRVGFTIDTPSYPTNNVLLDNLKASTGQTKGFFLGAPDYKAIDAGRDTTAMLNAMQDAFGMTAFRRYVLPDINSSTITTAQATAAVFDRLDQLKVQLRPGDNFVFYYSGHGVTLKESNAVNFSNQNEALVLGAEALLTDDMLTAYFAQDPIWSQVDKVFILDACHGGGFWTSTPDLIDARGRENNIVGATDLATLPRTALLAAAPEFREGGSLITQEQIDGLGLPGIDEFQPLQGMLTAAVVSGLKVGDDGYTMADLNNDGLSFRELMEWVRVAPSNELLGQSAVKNDYLLARVRARGTDPTVAIPWFMRTRFVGFERDGEFDPWSTEPIEFDYEAFAAATDDFGTAGVMELYTENEFDFLASLTSVPGDFNSDGVVNLADYTVWRDHLGSPAGTLPNDVTGADIGQAQYELWRAYFGYGVETSGALTAIPEPGTWLLAVAAVLLLLNIRKPQPQHLY